VWQRSPFKNNFIPSLRHNRQTGPIYLAIRFQYLPQFKRCSLQPLGAFLLLASQPMLKRAGVSEAGSRYAVSASGP